MFAQKNNEHLLSSVCLSPSVLSQQHDTTQHDNKQNNKLQEKRTERCANESKARARTREHGLADLR